MNLDHYQKIEEQPEVKTEPLFPLVEEQPIPEQSQTEPTEVKIDPNIAETWSVVDSGIIILPPKDIVIEPEDNDIPADIDRG